MSVINDVIYGVINDVIDAVIDDVIDDSFPSTYLSLLRSLRWVCSTKYP